MTATRKIDDWAKGILKGATIEGNVLKLPGQLPREDYQRINKVLVGLGGKWDRRLGGHVFAFDPGELVEKAANEGVYTDRKQDLQFFETPAEIAGRMVELAEVGPNDTVLEPSAGHGRIVSKLLAAGAAVVAVEIDATNAKVLREMPSDHLAILEMDFLKFAKPSAYNEFFDAVVMNPPFTGGQDIEHIRAAWNLLKPGGQLVAVLGEGAFFNSATKFANFRMWLNVIGAENERLPEGTFKESGTGVNTRLIWATKL